MHDELLKALREAHEHAMEWNRNPFRYVALYKNAADAIEELSKREADMTHNMATLSLKVLRLEEKLPRWIPVTERLPEEDTDVLCWYEYYHWSAEKVLPEYGIGHCWNGRWGGEVSTGRECKVLAWMPLPQPPKEET